MGFDVKAAADTVIAAIDSVPGPSAIQAAEQAQSTARDISNAIAANPGSFVSYTLAAILMMSILGLLWRVRTRLMRGIEETVFSNWQLGLLGATGIVLSLASGYTTWDGMRNFTGEPLLSGMVTFGIQGVMLIVAWLIGESFAVGMNQQSVRRDKGALGLDAMTANILGALVGIALFTAVVSLFVTGGSGVPTFPGAGTGPASGSGAGTLAQQAASWTKFGDQLLLIVTALLALAFVALFASSDLLKPYIQSTRIVVKNMILWVMFLACMATSVFFSFDSLFTSIFPQSERVRAAELRAQNQVAGLMADVEQRIVGSRLEEAQNLFSSPGFQTYDGQMTKLADASRAAASEIEAFFNQQLEDRNRAIKTQQERAASAQGAQAGLSLRRESIGAELIRLKSERPALAAEFDTRKADVEAKSKEVDVKRVEALAEAGGVEGTGKEGRGPVYRQRLDEQTKLQAAVKIAEERLADARKRLQAADSRITVIEREQSSLEGELAKLKGEQETADQRIKMAQEQLPSDGNTRVDPARITPTFENTRAEFRQEPTQTKLLQVQQLCTQIYTAMATASPGTKKAVADVECDPKQAAEAAAVVFALNAGTERFASSCKGGDKLIQNTSTDALFGFARKCLADSGLTSRETDQLRTRINFIELNRDDKAHRFVVTWNAFQDGNRLAYLALAIAIAIDSLVFMSGLFGANALRSPLSDVPTPRARSAQQLEATINAALGQNPFDAAQTVLSELRPITNTHGFSASVTLDGLDRITADRIRMVLTAGADIRAVERDEGYAGERYRVRSELREYLSSVVDRHLKRDKSLVQKARIDHVISAALRPHVHEHADLVIGHLHPMKPVEGFTSTVSTAALQASGHLPDAYDARVIRRVMNAGATVDMAAPDKTEDGRFYLRPDMYEALLMLSARSPKSPPGAFDNTRDAFYRESYDRRRVIEGGPLDAGTPRLEARLQPLGIAGPAGNRPVIPGSAAPSPNASGQNTPGLGASGSNDNGSKAQAAAAPQMPGRTPAQNVKGAPEAFNGKGMPEGDSYSRQEEFTFALLGGLIRDPAQFLGLMGPAYEAAASASDEFARIRRQSDAQLDRALTELDEEARMRFDSSYDALVSRVPPTDSVNLDALQKAYADIEQNWQLLMLLPGGPFERTVAELVEVMEPQLGAGQLPRKDEPLFASARQLRDALMINPRNSAASWDKLGRMLAAMPPPVPRPSNGNNQLT